MRYFAALLLSLLIGAANGQTVTGPLQAQNSLSEIAKNATQSTARGNLGFTGPVTLTGPVTTTNGDLVPAAHYDATAFGSCVWDGAHDVQPCIKAAAQAAALAGNAEVDLPAGVLPMSTSLCAAPSGCPAGNPTSGFILKGRGPGTILRPLGTNVASPLLLNFANTSNITVEDLTIDGGAAGGADVGQTSVFQGTIAGTALTVTTPPTNGVPVAVDQFLYCTGCASTVRILSGSGTSWTLSASQTVGSPVTITGVTPGLQGSISGTTVTTFGAITGAPLQVGDTLYWIGGSDTLATVTPSVTTTSAHTVAFQRMFASPTGLVPVSQLFDTSNVKFSRVIWQNSAGIGLNASGANRTTVIDSRAANLGNRWKGTLVANDRVQAMTFCCGDGATLGFDNSVTGSYFADIGLDPISMSGQTRVVVANNRMNLANNQVASLPTGAYPGNFFTTDSNYVPFTPTSHATITDNTITGAPGSAFDTQGLKYSVISGNTVDGSGGAGVGLFTNSPVVFTGAISTTTLTVSAITSGVFGNGMVIDSTGATAITGGTYITNIGTCGGSSPTLPCTATVNNSQSVSSEAMFAGVNAQYVSVTGNVFTNNAQWSSSSFTGGVTADCGEPDSITISGNTSGNVGTNTTQLYGVALSSNCSIAWTVHPRNVTVVGNTLGSNATAALLDASTESTQVIGYNGGVTDAIPSASSATTLALPVNPVISLTGTTTVTGISGPSWVGRQVTMIPTGVVAFTATNNIANAVTTSANVPITATYDGTSWYLK